MAKSGVFYRIRDKVVRLADRDTIGNGDFNNADVLRLNWLDLYDVKLVKESNTQYVIDMTAKKDSGAAYYLIRLWVLKAGGQPVQQYFYDNAGHHLKTLKYREIQKYFMKLIGLSADYGKCYNRTTNGA